MVVEHPQAVLMLVAGAKGAIGSTLALAVEMMANSPEAVLPYLTSTDLLPFVGKPEDGLAIAGWDLSGESMTETLRVQGVVPEERWRPWSKALDGIAVSPAPDPGLSVADQLKTLVRDIDGFVNAHPRAQPVLVNLLPACPDCGIDPSLTFGDLEAMKGGDVFQDVVYAMAAIRCGIPVVNFTPNDMALPAIVAQAERLGVPMAGRDGKTGQTYFKVVLASALKSRHLYVDGWYSLNILGNADGKNLMNPACAAGKLANKTDLLDDILGYPVGEGYGGGSHRVRIDYYPPRGDAKEAWDVIDVKGLFGLPMSIRINLQGRDSILAAPMAIDLARWVAAAKAAGRRGLLPELGFFFKKPEGTRAPVSFQDQWARLQAFGEELSESIR